MNTSRLILTLSGLAGLILGTGLAAEPAAPSAEAPRLENHVTGDHPAKPGGLPKPGGLTQPVGGKPAHAGVGSPASAKARQAGSVKAGQTAPVQPGINNLSAKTPPQPGLSLAAPVVQGVAKGGWPANKTENSQAGPGKLPVGGATTVALPSVVRSRSPEPVKLGGPVAGGAKNSLTGLNGSDFKVKHKF